MMTAPPLNKASPASTRTSARTGLDFLADGSDMGERIRTMDWSRTPVGPAEHWSPALQMVVRLMLANRFPMLLWWGPTFCSLYNDAYAPILGTKHPWALGRPVSECWSEIWEVLQPLIETPFHGGPATWMEDIHLEINRRGFVEETHFTIAYSPVPDETVTSGIGGVLATVHEITGQVVGDRRVRVLRDLGARSAEARTAEHACVIAAATLAQHAEDLPFALLYLIDPERTQARLAGSAGVAAGQAVSPPVIGLTDEAADRSPWPLREVLRSEAPRTVIGLADRLGDQVPPGPWSGPPQTAVVAPLRSNKAHVLAGFLVAGISARLPLDEAYHDFLDLVASQIATAIAKAREYEAEKKRAEALAEIDRAKTLFFSNVSHEFRTPLTLMLGPTEDAVASPERALRGEDLATVHRNALRLLKLVNTLLDFSRLEAGRIEASYEPVDLAALTADLASVFRAAIEKAGLRLVVDCLPLPEPVYVDREMWEKIVLNLLSNAFKFTFEGDITVTVRWRGDHAELAVSDTGTGIPPDQLAQVFERFHRVPNAHSRTHEGTGIGLALVKELVRYHGGSIGVDSDVDRGTTFTVCLPTGCAHLPSERLRAARTLTSTALGALPYVEEALRWLPEAECHLEAALESGAVSDREVPAGAPDTSGEPARVLVADDNADLRQYLRQLLSPHWTIEAVADGGTALDAIRREPPDLVLTDIMMPGLDGFELLRRLRADPATREIPVILLSARAGEEARVEGLAAGTDDYLVKPFSARELVARVRAHLELAHVRRNAKRALRESEARLAAETEALARLNEASSRLWRLRDLGEGLDEMLAAALDLLSADKGSLQVLEAQRGVLTIAAQRGFSRDFLDFFREVSAAEDSASGRALRSGERLLIEDVETDPLYAPFRSIARAAGYRAVQATPLLGRDGAPLGMLSTYFRSPHRPSEPDLRRLDLYARQAADFIERCQVDEALKWRARRDELLSDMAARLLESEDPQALVEDLCRKVMAFLDCQAFFNFLVDERVWRLRLNACSGIPDAEAHRIEWLDYGVAVCGGVARDGHRIIAEEIPNLPDLRTELVKSYGLQAYCCHPLLVQGRLLGTLSFGTRSRPRFSPDEIAIMQTVTSWVAIAMHRIETERALRASEERYRALTRASSEVIYRMSPDWTEMNQLEGRDFLTDTTAPSRSWLRKYILPEDQPHITAVIQEAIRTQRIFELEHRVLRADGSLGWTFSRAVPLFNAEGDLVEWFGAASDITARKQAAEALREADRRKDEFLAMLAHELRNPLAPIRTALQVLRKTLDSNPTADQLLDMMDRQMTHLVRLVDDLLEVSRITRGKIELRKARVNLATIISQAVEVSKMLIEAGHHALEVALPPEPLLIEADPVRLTQVFTNLLNNAAKYMEPGGTIRVRAERHGSQVVVSVRDTGIGMPAELLPRVFELFTQADRNIDRTQGGLGIGLALVHHLVEMHGGTVTAHSAGPGCGSEFVVYLPVRVEPPKVQKLPDRSEVSTPVAARRILIVDDNRDAADSLAELLALAGHETRIAYDGEEGFKVAESFHPEVVLLDLGMPKMDGYEACRHLREQPWGRGIAAVALTGWGQEEDRRQARAAGFDAHVVKPVDYEALMALIAGMPIAR